MNDKKKRKKKKKKGQMVTFEVQHFNFKNWTCHLRLYSSCPINIAIQKAVTETYMVHSS